MGQLVLKNARRTGRECPLATTSAVERVAPSVVRKRTLGAAEDSMPESLASKDQFVSPPPGVPAAGERGACGVASATRNETAFAPSAVGR
jgi:hypothetical protein